MQINDFWKKLRDLLKEPSQEQVECQLPKSILLDTGEMFVPYEWAVWTYNPQYLLLKKKLLQISLTDK